MVTSKQIISGAAMWVDSEILPMMHGATRYGASVAAGMGAKWLESKLNKALGSEVAKELGIVRDGGFDLETLRTVMLERFPSDGLRIEAEQINKLVSQVLGKLRTVLNIQMEGAVTFHRADLEKLYQYILGG